MQKIVPHLWFRRNAQEASEFYQHALPDTRVTAAMDYPAEGLPDFQKEFAGELLTVELEISGFRIGLINAGEEFRPDPAISFLLNFDPSRDPHARETLTGVWDALRVGGDILVPLGEYPHSPLFGWVEDRYGVSWQLMLTDPQGEPRPFIVPFLMFGGQAQNRAREAIDHYLATFDGAAPGSVVTYTGPAGPATTNSIMFAEFTLAGQWFAAMDSKVDQPFSFTPGVSLAVQCEDQREIDRYWEALSAVPEAEACGWCADRFGVSWQIVPESMETLLEYPQAYQRMLEMKKLDITALRGD